MHLLVNNHSQADESIFGGVLASRMAWLRKGMRSDFLVLYIITGGHWNFVDRRDVCELMLKSSREKEKT
jgi:hypothetical protein